MRREDTMVIRITQNGEVLVEDINDGVIGFKQVAPETFMDCIKQSIDFGVISSGVLPAGAFSFAAHKNIRNVCMEFLPRRCDFFYLKTEYKNFPLPRLVFGFHLSDDKIQSVKLGVVGKGMLKPTMPMYLYPFSNVFGFSLCCGANRLPKIQSLHQLTGAMYYIMSMPNNNDRYQAGATKLEMEYRDLLEHLKDKDPDYYYENVLVESDKTLQDFINA